MHSIVLSAERKTVGVPAPPAIQRESPLDRADWDVWIAGQPGLSFFHSAAWAAVLHRTYGFQPAYFTATRGTQLAALLPVMEINSWLTGRRGASLPFTDFCEPLGVSGNIFGDVLRAVLDHGRARKWKYFECRGGAEALEDAPASVSFYGHRLSLIADADYLFTRLHSSVRRAIRKAQNSGLVIDIAQDLDAVRTYYSLHCRTRREHGLPPQPFRFFRNIYEHVLAHNLGIVITARHRGRPAASAIFFRRGTEAIYKIGASDRRCQELRANNLVMWEAIKWHACRGIKTLHFGRTSLENEGLRRFKLGWGVDEHLIRYHQYDFNRGAFVTSRDAAHGWHNRFFRLLPVFALRWAGTALYRHIA